MSHRQADPGRSRAGSPYSTGSPSPTRQEALTGRGRRGDPERPSYTTRPGAQAESPPVPSAACATNCPMGSEPLQPPRTSRPGPRCSPSGLREKPAPVTEPAAPRQSCGKQQAGPEHSPVLALRTVGLAPQATAGHIPTASGPPGAPWNGAAHTPGNCAQRLAPGPGESQCASGVPGPAGPPCRAARHLWTEAERSGREPVPPPALSGHSALPGLPETSWQEGHSPEVQVHRHWQSPATLPGTPLRARDRSLNAGEQAGWRRSVLRTAGPREVEGEKVTLT